MTENSSGPFSSPASTILPHCWPAKYLNELWHNLKWAGILHEDDELVYALAWSVAHTFGSPQLWHPHLLTNLSRTIPTKVLGPVSEIFYLI